MSKPFDDGGPAFPATTENGCNTGVWGLSMRDYFAGQALAGIMANPERWKQIAADYESGKKSYDECSQANAIKAYSLADAMIAARVQP